MTDRDAFLSAIRAQPDEDTPRLAFADWLDEQGTKPDQFRAEYIRTACGFTRAEPHSERWLELGRKFTRLNGRVPAAWTAHLKGRVIASDFERGFVGHVTMYSKRFVAEGGKLFDADPIRTVKFATLKSARGSVPAAVLFACPHLARAARLVLDGSELKDKEITLLAESPHAANLRAVWLGGKNPFAQASVPKLLKARPGITELHLTANTDFGDGHAKALAGSPALLNLTDLNLTGAGLTAAGVAALAASPHAANLRTLRVGPIFDEYDFDEDHYDRSDARGGSPEGIAIAEAFAASTALASLEELDLRERLLGDKGVTALAKARGLPALRRLGLQFNQVTKKGAEALAKSPLGQQLKYIDFERNVALHPQAAAIQALFPNARVRATYAPDFA